MNPASSKSTTSSRALYARLLRYVVPHWRMFALSLGAMVVVALTEPAFPALLKPMLDGSFVKRDPAAIQLIPWALIGLFLVRGLATYVSTYAISSVSNRLVMDLRTAMFGRLIELPTRYYDAHSSGALIANIAFNVTQVTNAATSVITILVRDAITVVGLLGWMLYLNWKLTMIALIAAPLITIIVKLFSRRLRNVSRQSQHSLGDVTHVLEESIECHKVVKIFGGQDYERERFFRAVNRSRQLSMKQMAASAANVPIVQFIAAAALAVIVYLATVPNGSTQTTVGGFVSFITAMLMLFSPIKRLTGVNEPLQRGLAAAEVVFELIDEMPETDGGSRTLGRAQGKVEFRDVSFTYPNARQSALEHLSLAIQPGETLALVGQSGSGKTTLVNLIARLYEPSEGTILIDDIDLRELKLADLRSNVALVSQDVVLFNDTVAANIAYGRQASASRAEIEAAAVAAHAMEFIAQMPQGLDTFIGDNGVRLSGGQRQRLAIARALLKNAPILILDEATSALDTQSERHVQAALETLMQGRTTIVIAHRLSTIESADRIVVMQKGRIEEMGSHHALLQRGGIYEHLYRLQFRPSAKVDAAAAAGQA